MNRAGEHRHQPVASAGSLAAAVALTIGFAAVEALAGWWSGSLALASDAGHMLGDGAALGLAGFAAWLAKRPRTHRHTYGFARAEVLAGMANAVFMFALIAAIAAGAIGRLRAPAPVAGEAVTVVALIGLAINLAVAWLLARGERNLNTRAALLHVLGDLLGSAAALVSGVVIVVTGWTPVDPILSLAIAGLILVSSLRVLREAVHGLMEGAPFFIDPESVGRALADVPGVASVHDLHIWSVASDRPMLSAHVVVHELARWEGVLETCQVLLTDRFGIRHATLQPEPLARTVRFREPSEREPAVRT